jgi:hypothetical protein
MHMPYRTITTNLVAPARRRRPPRPLDVLGLVPEERTAAAMDDQQEADELMADLLALVEAGLIAPVHEHGAVRYAPTNPDDPDPAA